MAPLKREIFSEEAIEVFKNMVTDTCYVIGAGPAGKPYWSLIPDEAFSIGINSTIKEHNNAFKLNAWAVTDKRTKKDDWYAHGLKQKEVYKIMNRSLADREAHFIYTVRRHSRDFDKSDKRNQIYRMLSFPNVMVGMGSTAFICLQILYLAGVKHIILCGIDMHGQLHFDGTVGNAEQWKRKQTIPEGHPCKKKCVEKGRGDVWGHVRWLQPLVWYMQEQGVKIESLSPTALLVDEIGDELLAKQSEVNG